MTAVVTGTQTKPRVTGTQSAPAELGPRTDWRFLASAVLGYLLLRIPASLWPLKPDESGFLLVAREWHPTTDNMYGFLWVDRPPILIGVYRLADIVAGPYGPRAAGALLWVAMILAVYRTGFLIGGRAAARWATVATVALASQPLLETWSAKSEALGAPLVAVSCWLTLEALHRQHSRWTPLLAFGAGLAAALALGMKQSLGGGVVFGVVVLIQAVRVRRVGVPDAAKLAASAAAGFGVVVAGVLVWAEASGVRLRVLWEMIFGFRSEGFAVITSQDMSAPLERADELVLLAIITGMAIVALWFVISFPTVLRSNPVVAPAVAAMLVADLIALAVGGSYWTSYLTPLIPDIAIAVALLASIGARRLIVTRGVTLVAVVSALYAMTTVTIDRSNGTDAPSDWYSGQAIGAAARPGDSIMVLYGRADIVQASGLRPAYPYLWSLPMRVLDPELVRVRAVVASQGGPTWIVQEGDLNWQGLDPLGRLGDALGRNYRVVGSACEDGVWLHRGIKRSPLPEVDCSRPWEPFLLID